MQRVWAGSTDKYDNKQTNQHVSRKMTGIMIGEWPYQSQSTTKTTYDGLELKRQRKQNEEKNYKTKRA